MVQAVDQLWCKLSDVSSTVVQRIFSDLGNSERGEGVREDRGVLLGSVVVDTGLELHTHLDSWQEVVPKVGSNLPANERVTSRYVVVKEAWSVVRSTVIVQSIGGEP